MKIKNENEIMSQGEPDGNTKSSGISTTGNQLYRWFFTLDESKIQLSQLLEVLKEIAKEFVFSLEQGEKTDYKHYQGVFSLRQKERFSTVKNHFPISIHLEACKDWWASKKYCTKSETHIDGPWDEESCIIPIISELRPWQLKLEQQLLSEPKDREIFWIWDEKGNSGKTAFAKYLIIKHKACYFNNGKTSDIAFALPKNPKIVVFNFARSNKGRINYMVIEQLKDGICFSSKYESKTKIFNIPHVVCFANFHPEVEALSIDRWNILKINDTLDFS